MSDYGGYDPNQAWGQAPQAYVPPTSGDWQGGAQLPTSWNFNMDEAEEPRNFSPLPAGIYNVACVDFSVGFRGNKTVVTLTNIVEGGPQNERLIDDDIFMPDKSTQTYDAYKKSLGFMRQRLSAYYNQPVVGNIQFDPQSLIGKTCTIEVTVRQDIIPNQFDEQGQPAKYPPRNRILSWHPRQNGAGPAPVGMGTVPQQVPPQWSPPPAPPVPPSVPMSPPGLSATSPDGTVRNASPAPASLPSNLPGSAPNQPVQPPNPSGGMTVPPPAPQPPEAPTPAPSGNMLADQGFSDMSNSGLNPEPRPEQTSGDENPPFTL